MTHQLRPNLPPLPERMQNLPVDHRGYPVPFFVAWVDGKPDFRIMDARKRSECVQWNLCWLCGKKLGAHRAFVVGPMCAVNRVSAEPPSHRDCAIFAATACPFLVRPKAERRDANMPSGWKPAPGFALARNPGVALVWITRGPPKRFRAPGGYLFDIGEPAELLCFAEGRPATRSEINESIESGMPLLMAEAEKEGQGAIDALKSAHLAAMSLLPPGEVRQ